uniref:COG4177: ABC-type branched-chain amino acid transport system, permease component n=1 Tax=uncultured bacterium UPO38 TaxID=1776965 RepID=A0A126SZI1_9BACT|nr:COG4177: ABC-type branched-chain amino acid transport system, permease component [uncultured bacterium UPO38]
MRAPDSGAAGAMPLPVSAPARARRLPHLLPWVAAAALAAALPLVAPNAFYLAIANLVLVNAAVAVSLTLLVGTTGQLSLGHAAFFASGAYVTAHLSAVRGWPVLASLPAAVLVSTLLAWAVGRLFLRLSGYYLAVATLGVGLLLGIVLRNEPAFSGGPDGMSVPLADIGGFVLRGDRSWYWVLLAVLCVVVVGAVNLLRSPAGRALRALHDAETAAVAMGVDACSYRVRIFTLSGAVAGLAGALYAHYAGFVTPQAASFVHSVQFLMMAVIGGVGSIAGAVVGAAIVTLLPNLLADAAEYETLAVGLLLLLCVVLMPRGIVPTLRRARTARRTRSRA